MLRTFLSFAAVLPLLLLAAGQSSAAAAQTASGGAAAKSAVPTAVININTASAAELESLPGVGPRTATLIVEYRQKNGPFKKIEELMNVRGIGAKTAARIVEYRQKNGPFKKVEELMNVRGVGEKNFLRLKAQISVGAAKGEHERPNQ